MSDYNDIALLRAETAVMAAISGMVGSALKFDPSSDSNIPTNSKRLVDIGGNIWRFQNWNGASWVHIPLDAATIDTLDSTDFDYVAGDGIDITGDTITLEQATDTDLGGAVFAASGDMLSGDKMLSPLVAKEMIDASGSFSEEVVSGQILVANKQYMLPTTNASAVLVLPDSPPDGSIIRVFSRDASQGAVAFLSPGMDEVVLADGDSKVVNLTGGTITSSDNFDVVDSSADFSTIDWSGFRVVNTTDGSVGLVEAVAASTVLSCSNPTLIGGASNVFTAGDLYQVDGKSAYIPASMEFGLCELIFRNSGGFKRWSFSLVGNSVKSVFANPDGASRNFLVEVGSLYDVLAALDVSLNARLNAANPFYITTSYNLRSNFVGSAYDICVSSSEVVATMKGVSNGGSRHVANFGIANLVLRVGENIAGAGTTSSALAVGSALVAASATDIVVPPGAYAVVHRRNDENGSAGDDKIAYVTGSAGCTKA